MRIRDCCRRCGSTKPEDGDVFCRDCGISTPLVGASVPFNSPLTGKPIEMPERELRREYSPTTPHRLSEEIEDDYEPPTWPGSQAGIDDAYVFVAAAVVAATMGYKKPEVAAKTAVDVAEALRDEWERRRR